MQRKNSIDMSKYLNEDEHSNKVGSNSIDMSKYIDDSFQKHEPEKKGSGIELKDLFSFEHPVKKLAASIPMGAIGGVGGVLPKVFPNMPGDILTGLTRAAENIPKSFLGDRVPTVDVNKVFGADRGSKLLQDVSQYSPLMALPGGSMIKNIMSAAPYTGIQYAGESPSNKERLPEAIKGMLMGTAMAVAPAALEAVGKPAFNALKAYISSSTKGNPLIRQQKADLKSSILEKEKKLSEAEKEYQSQLQQEEQAKILSEQETGKSKPSIMRYGVTEGENLLSEKQQNILNLNKQLEDQKNLPELPKIDTKNYETNVSNAAKSLDESQKHVENTINTHQQAKLELLNTESEIGKMLKSGEPHDEIIASRIRPELERLEEEIPKEYASVIEEAKKLNVPVPQEAMKNYLLGVKDYGQLLYGKRKIQLPELSIKPTGNPYLDDILSHAPTALDTNVGTFMDKVKDLREMIYQTERMRETELLASNRTQMTKAISEAKKVLSSAKSTLDNSLGNLSPRWKKANENYSQILWPLRESKIAQQIMENTTMGDNIIKSLRGTDKANVLLRNMIKSDPESLVHAVGQRYDSSPQKFFKKNTRLKEYSDYIPGFKELIDKRLQGKSFVEKSEFNIKAAKERNAEIKNHYKQAELELKSKESEKQKIESEKIFREKQEKNIKEKINDENKNIRDKQSKIDVIKKHIELLEKESLKTNITKEKLNSIKEEIKQEKLKYRELKDSVDKSKNNLFRLARYGFRATKKIVKKIIE